MTATTAPATLGAAPDIQQDADRRAPSTMSEVIGTRVVIATMRVGRAFVMPVVITVLLTLMLTAPAH